MKSTKANVTKLAITVLCSAVIFCGCAKDSDVVLKVNDKEITRAEFYGDFNKIKNAQFKNAPANIKKDTSYAVLSLKERYVNDVIMRSLLTQEFEKRNISVSENELKAKKDQIIAQVGSQEQLDKLLKENNITEDRLNEDMTSEIKIEKLLKSLKVSEATDADAQKFYNENKSRFATPERVLAYHILIDVNPENIKRKLADADKDASLTQEQLEQKVAAEVQRKEALAKEVAAKAQKNPKDFAKLAKQYSDDEASAQKGGELGYIGANDVVKEFSQAAFALKPNTVSGLVKSQFGYHIIYVKDKAKAGAQSFDTVKKDIKQYLSEQKKQEAAQKFFEGLKNGAKIEYVDESLKPENLKKQLDEALKKQVDAEKKKSGSQSKLKNLQQKQEENQEKTNDSAQK